MSIKNRKREVKVVVIVGIITVGVIEGHKNKEIISTTMIHK
jgi:hypothetical protein